jgi:hypothetical protein
MLCLVMEACKGRGVGNDALAGAAELRANVNSTKNYACHVTLRFPCKLFDIHSNMFVQGEGTQPLVAGRYHTGQHLQHFPFPCTLPSHAPAG